MRTPAYCDAPRGVARQRGGSCSKIWGSRRHTACARDEMLIQLQASPNGQEVPQKPPQTLPKLLPNPPKWTKNRARRPLGDHLGPMLEKNSVLNVPKTAKRRPRAPERGPKAPQPSPKWSPRPSQIQFLCDFLALYLPIPNLHRIFIDIV